MKNVTLRVLCVAMVAACSVVAAGCSATPIGLATSLVGAAVNDVDVQNRKDKLLGQPIAMADAELGPPLHRYQDASNGREYRVYAVPNDVLKRYGYIIETAGSKVIWLAKAKKGGDIAVDLATLTIVKGKVIGESPAVCETELKMGPAVLSVKDLATGTLTQCYDARLVEEVQRPYWCVLRFDIANRCEKVELVQIQAAAGDRS